MPNIHFCTGEKGGVGKSFKCRTLAQYLLDHGIDFQLIETDRSNPDCYRIYGKIVDCKLCIFSESEKLEDGANNILNSGLEKLTLVNLPAQVFIPVREWFTKNEILAIAAEADIDFWFWFCTDGGYDSIELLKKTIDFYQDGVRYVVVLNEGRNDDWAAWESDKQLQRLLKKSEASIITLPKLLGSICKNRMDADSLTFGEALVHKDFSLIDKQRIKRFLRDSYQAIEMSGAFNNVIQ